MNERLECPVDVSELMKQAPMTVADYFLYLSEKFPNVSDEVIATLVLAASVDFHASIITKIHTEWFFEKV